MLKYDSRLKSFSRQLRINMSDAEQLLWRHLRRKQILGVQFYRQKPIGLFIVDFYAPALNLVIELDGGQHFEPEAMKYDQQRDEYLRQQGLCVMRFDNLQVMKEAESVLNMIYEFAGAAKSDQIQIPPSPPFPKGEIATGSSARGGAAVVADDAVDGVVCFAQIEKTLGEWLSEEDERAYREL